MKTKDSMTITIGLGDGEWFADYVISVKGKFHQDSCQPGYPGAQEDYKKSRICFKTTQQRLQLDKKSYHNGDSIKGYVDDKFDISGGAAGWKAHIHLVGPFKTVVLCDTCPDVWH